MIALMKQDGGVVAQGVFRARAYESRSTCPRTHPGYKRRALYAPMPMSNTAFVLAFAATIPGVSSHGWMNTPASWQTNFVSPSTACGGVDGFPPDTDCIWRQYHPYYWYNQGCQIGCSACSGFQTEPNKTDGPPKKHCPEGMDNGTLPDSFRTMQVFPQFQWNPWMAPGFTPLTDSCGIAGGWNYSTLDQYKISNGSPAPPVVKAGTFGTHLKSSNALGGAVWRRGMEAEVSWKFIVNHGGGYQYRLCPFNETPSEECFARTPLSFVNSTSWIQRGSVRFPIRATRLSLTEVVKPEGSVWTRNPVPPCLGPWGGGEMNCIPTEDVGSPVFEPPLPGFFGYGLAVCIQTNMSQCTHEEYETIRQYYDVSVVDVVRVPRVPPGKYVLGWRWDVEQTSQVWANCATVDVM